MGKTHVVPTHLRTPEVLLSVGGFNVSVRQFLIVFLSAGFGYALWQRLHVVDQMVGGSVLRLIGAGVLVLMGLVLAFFRLAGRTFEQWAVIVVRFVLRPRRLVWRSVRFAEPDALSGWSFAEEKEEQHG